MEKINLEKNKLTLIKNILKISLEGGNNAAHIGGALSSVDILNVLFFSVMNFNKENVLDEKRDRFVLSKGHACLVLYSALLEKKIISKTSKKF